jgi:phosphopantothenoylcysteine decarboxylase/phosphopantothenate--cysteine ligase
LATKLKNKKVLITAGPTWIPIDNVRVISNVASGQTGIMLAEKLLHLGAKVTLLLGPVSSCCINKKIKVRHFKFFDDLFCLLREEIAAKKYDIVIHSAAVSDYRPKAASKQKIKSGLKEWTLTLVQTPKIIDLVKKIDPTLFLAGFKFHPGVNWKVLTDEARILIRRSGADLVVANTFNEKGYQAKVVGESFCSGVVFSKKLLIEKLIKAIGENLCS